MDHLIEKSVLLSFRSKMYFDRAVAYERLLCLKESLYSRTSCKRPPKMSSLGGCLHKVVAYESVDCVVSRFCLISIRQRLNPCFKCFFPLKSQFPNFRLLHVLLGNATRRRESFDEEHWCNQIAKVINNHYYIT